MEAELNPQNEILFNHQNFKQLRNIKKQYC